MDELYTKNQDFKEYVDKYCTKHKISKEIAFTHNLIKAIALIYETRSQKHSEGGNV